MINRYDVKYRCYSHDTQVYMMLIDLGSLDETFCGTEVCQQLDNNLSKLNRSLFIQTDCEIKTGQFCLTVGTSYTESSEMARNLNIFLHNFLGEKKQVNAICNLC